MSTCRRSSAGSGSGAARARGARSATPAPVPPYRERAERDDDRKQARQRDGRVREAPPEPCHALPGGVWKERQHPSKRARTHEILDIEILDSPTGPETRTQSDSRPSSVDCSSVEQEQQEVCDTRAGSLWVSGCSGGAVRRYAAPGMGWRKPRVAAQRRSAFGGGWAEWCADVCFRGRVG